MTLELISWVKAAKYIDNMIKGKETRPLVTYRNSPVDRSISQEQVYTNTTKHWVVDGVVWVQYISYRGVEPPEPLDVHKWAMFPHNAPKSYRVNTRLYILSE